MHEQIKELKEKLRFANTTIAELIDKDEAREQQIKDEAEQSVSQSSFSQMSGKKLSEKINRINDEGYETESVLPPEMLQLKIEDLEMRIQDLIDEIESNKQKARGLLMRKELSERRIKLVVYKMESYLKSDKGGNLNQEAINQIGQLTEHEMLEQYELEKELEDDI